MPWESFRDLRLLSIPGKESISSYIYIFCNTQTGFLQVPGAWCTLKSLDEIHCSCSMIKWETLWSQNPTPKKSMSGWGFGISKFIRKLLAQWSAPLRYRFHKAATPMYTSMLTTDAAAARDGINAGLAAEYGPGAGPPGPGARYEEEAGEGEVAVGAGAGAGTGLRANTAGSNTRISIITTANLLLDITLLSFWTADAAIFPKKIFTRPNSTLRTHKQCARLLCRNSKEIDLSEDVQEPGQGCRATNFWINTWVIIQIATGSQVVYIWYGCWRCISTAMVVLKCSLSCLIVRWDAEIDVGSGDENSLYSRVYSLCGFERVEWGRCEEGAGRAGVSHVTEWHVLPIISKSRDLELKSYTDFNLYDRLGLMLWPSLWGPSPTLVTRNHVIITRNITC